MPGFQLIALSNAMPGREAEYREWYCGRHLADVVAVPGFRSGSFYEAADVAGLPSPRRRYMGVFQMEFERPQQGLIALNAMAGTPQMPLTDAIDPSSVSMTVGIIVQTLGRVSTAATSLLAVMTHAAVGQFDEYDRWYREQHLPDALGVPGCLWAQRSQLQRMPDAAPPEWQHAVLFGLGPAWPQAIAEMLSRLGGPEMPVSAALDMARSQLGVYRPLATRG